MKNRVHLICNAHLDPVWQWRWTEGCSEAIATFRNAVEIIHEYPELIFNHNEAILYQWVKKYDARLFNEIRELVAQNRWFIAGGWFLQPDVNLPPYENLVRHIRIGREFFKGEFGVEPKVAYNFDSFGHTAGLPKLLRDFGYEFYVHQRPEQEFMQLPDSLYQWKGLHGASIPAYRIEIGLYHSERKNITQRLTEATNLALKLNRDVALFWGLGNHGGGATRIDLDRIREFTADEQRVEFMHSTTDRFYEAIKPLIPNLPLYEGSLQRVFTGCYTSLSRIKRKAIEASGAVLQAEKLIDIVPPPTPSLARRGQEPLTGLRIGLGEVWEDILFNDFHDILPGSCTEPAEQDALDLYGRAMENIRRLNMQSITSINQSVAPLKAHIPVTVFNSNAGLTTMPVEFECMSDYRPFWEGEWTLKLFDRQGNEIACQEEQPDARLPFHRWRRKISFLAKDLAPGVHHYYLTPVETSPNHTNSLSTSPNPLLINEGARNSTSALKESTFVPRPSLSFPRTRGPFANSQDLPKISFLVLNDTADSWGTNAFSYRDLAGKFEPEHPERIIETGPIRNIYESNLTFHHSKITVHRICYADWPVTEYKIRIQWNEEQKRLKLAIPVPVENAKLTAQISGGSEIFPPNSQEHVHGTWLSLGVPDTRHPIPDTLPPDTRHPTPDTLPPDTRHPTPDTLLLAAHNGLHGFDYDGSEVRLSILRSAAFCHEQGYNLDNGRSHKFMDIGIHEVRLAIWEQGPDPDAVSEWLNAPPLVWPHLPIG
jgi:alpha-mannosidase